MKNDAFMLSLSHVHKAFHAVKAVEDLSLAIREGEVFGLLGPNGAGKTTTVNLSVGLLAPDRGEIRIGTGGSPLEPACRSLFGVAPQALALYEDLSGRENLAFFARLQGLAGGKLRDSVDRALDFVDLAGRARERVKRYSGGMKRRLNLACALVHDPPLLLLDEPTAGVDPQSRNALFENIRALQARGRTVIYTTHYMEEAQRLCDRVGIIDRGRLLALDTVDGLIAAHGGRSVIEVHSGDRQRRLESDDPLGDLIRIKAEERLDSFRVIRPDLEQVFLNLTGRKLRD